MEKTLAVINQMQADGVIGKYAIGGAIAAFYYIEPAATKDLDIFIALDPEPGGLVLLAPIYNYLKTKGYREECEAVLIENWAVQFLPASDPLLQEALDTAGRIEFQGAPTRIFRAEYLMAISLRTGRDKDYARLAQFIEENIADQTLFTEILKRHHLIEQWEKFKNRPPSNP